MNVDAGVGIITTRSGNKIDLTCPNPDLLTIEDVAHALSNICRFNGHTKDFYSVAQHSILVSRMVPKEYKMCALMHDASEAYLGDVTRPLRQLITGYDVLENRIMELLAERFCFQWPIPREVKEADDMILRLEYQTLILGKWPSPLEPTYNPKTKFIEKYYEYRGDN